MVRLYLLISGTRSHKIKQQQTLGGHSHLAVSIVVILFEGLTGKS
jgi:hypothetical protein